MENAYMTKHLDTANVRIYLTTLWVRVNWCRFTALGLYVGDSRFESQPEHSHD
jgi:hypothetical protein